MQLPYSSYDITITNSFRNKEPLLIELMRYRYRYAFISAITGITAGTVNESRSELAFEEALKRAFDSAMDGKFIDVKQMENFLSFHFIGYFSMVQNCTEQVGFLELETEFRKKMRFDLKKYYLTAFPKKEQDGEAPAVQAYNFTFDSYYKGNEMDKLFIRGLFYYPMLSFTNTITRNSELDEKIVNIVFFLQHHRKRSHTSYYLIADFLYHGCRARAFDYLKELHKEKQHVSFLISTRKKAEAKRMLGKKG